MGFGGWDNGTRETRMPQRNTRRPPPSAIDPNRIGEADRPENDWGPPETGAVRGVNHTRRTEDGPTARLQGAKTRRATKDQISRRA